MIPAARLRAAYRAVALYMNNWSDSMSATTLAEATWTTLLSFTADGNGTGTCDFSVSHSWGSNGLLWVQYTRTIRIKVNGTVVATASQNYTTGSWSATLTGTGISVPAGASVIIEGYAGNPGYTQPRTVTISAASMTVQSVA